MLGNTEARPLRGHKVIEVRPFWANKGEIVAWMAAQTPGVDFWFAAGDDRTDEDAFIALRKRGSRPVTVRIESAESPEPTAAEFVFASIDDLRDVIRAIAERRGVA